MVDLQRQASKLTSNAFCDSCTGAVRNPKVDYFQARSPDVRDRCARGKTFLRLFLQRPDVLIARSLAIKLLNSVVDCVRLARAVVSTF